MNGGLQAATEGGGASRLRAGKARLERAHPMELCDTREGLYPYEFGVDGKIEDHPNA